MNPDQTVTIIDFEIIICNTSIYTMDHPRFNVSNQKDKSFSTKSVKNDMN